MAYTAEQAYFKAKGYLILRRLNFEDFPAYVATRVMEGTTSRESLFMRTLFADYMRKEYGRFDVKKDTVRLEAEHVGIQFAEYTEDTSETPDQTYERKRLRELVDETFKRDKRYAHIMHRMLEGATADEVSKELGLSAAMVSRMLKENIRPRIEQVAPEIRELLNSIAAR